MVLFRNVILNVINAQKIAECNHHSVNFFRTADEFRHRNENDEIVHHVICLSNCQAIYNKRSDLVELHSELVCSLKPDETLVLCLFSEHFSESEIAECFETAETVAKLTLEFIRACRQSLTDAELHGLMEKCLIGKVELFSITLRRNGEHLFQRKLDSCVLKLSQKLNYMLLIKVCARMPTDRNIVLYAENCRDTHWPTEVFQSKAVSENGKQMNGFHEDSKKAVARDSTENLECPFSKDWMRQLLNSLPVSINVGIFASTKSASILSCLDECIPHFHFLCSSLSPDDIKVCRLDKLSSPECIAQCFDSGEKKACLVANSGLIVIGETLEEALRNCELFEQLCEWYLQLLSLSTPKLNRDSGGAHVSAADKDSTRTSKISENKDINTSDRFFRSDISSLEDSALRRGFQSAEEGDLDFSRLASPAFDGQHLRFDQPDYSEYNKAAIWSYSENNSGNLKMSISATELVSNVEKVADDYHKISPNDLTKFSSPSKRVKRNNSPSVASPNSDKKKGGIDVSVAKAKQRVDDDYRRTFDHIYSTAYKRTKTNSSR